MNRILEGVRAKKFEVTLLFEDFSKAFDSINTRKMEHILLAHSLSKEMVTAIMTLDSNSKVEVPVV